MHEALIPVLLNHITQLNVKIERIEKNQIQLIEKLNLIIIQNTK